MKQSGLAGWSDGAKIALLSSLSLPFAVGWLARIHQLEGDPTASTYAARDFFPYLFPFLWVQLIGHVVLVVLGIGWRHRGRAPWLVHAENQLWCVCLAFALYFTGTFTSPFLVILMVLPVIGLLLFEPLPVLAGMITLGVGTLVGAALPLLGVTRYAPFLAHAPYADGELQTAWIVSFGVPTLFAIGVGLFIYARMVRRLRDLSRTDSLTGLANRAVLFEQLDVELSRARRHHLPVCVIMLDVDRFKVINDHHGHQVGDRVLRELGAVVRGALRTVDLAARYGGEELAIVLPHTTAAAAAVVANRLLEAARTVKIAEGSQVTVSLGVAELTGDETAQTLFGRADAALYRAKDGGRDRFEVG